MPFDKIFTNTDIKKNLRDYSMIIDFKYVSKGTHIRYMKKMKGGGFAFRMGGYFRNAFDDYILLYNDKRVWSVQKKTNVFFSKNKVKPRHFKSEIDQNNKKIVNLGGKPICLTNPIDDVEKDNNDIFSLLSKTKEPTDNSVDRIRKKHKLTNWRYLKQNQLSQNDVVYLISLDGKTRSDLGIIINIQLYENKSIKIIELCCVDWTKNMYKWKIKPQKYYIFKHPKTANIVTEYAFRASSLSKKIGKKIGKR